MSSLARHLVPLKGSPRLRSFGSASRESILSVNKGIISLNPRVNLLHSSNVSPFKNKFLYLSSIAFLMFQPERTPKATATKASAVKCLILILSLKPKSPYPIIYIFLGFTFLLLLYFRGLENSTFFSPNVTAITGRDVHVNEERNVYF